MRKIIPLLFLISLLIGCGSDGYVEAIIYDVPEEVQPYVDQFIAEAKAHGQEIVIDNLIIELTTPVENGGQFVCGVTYGEIIGQTQNRIVIDTECLAWRHSDRSREILVFHELGHAILFRNHRTDKLPNNDFASIMVGTTWNIDDFYIFDTEKRQYYIDELFDSSTPIPDWAE